MKGDCIRCSMSCLRSLHWIRGARSGRFSPRLLGRMRRPASNGQLGSGFKLHWFKWIVREKAGRLHHCHMDVTRHWRAMGSMPVWICHCDQKHKSKQQPGSAHKDKQLNQWMTSTAQFQAFLRTWDFARSKVICRWHKSVGLIYSDPFQTASVSCSSEQVRKHEQSSQTTAGIAADPILLFR